MAGKSCTKGLVEFVEYVFNLDFEEEPDYGKISFLLTKNLLDLNLTPSNDFDWNKVETIKTKIAALRNRGLVSDMQVACSFQNPEYAKLLFHRNRNYILTQLHKEDFEDDHTASIPDETPINDLNTTNKNLNKLFSMSS